MLDDKEFLLEAISKNASLWLHLSLSSLQDDFDLLLAVFMSHGEFARVHYSPPFSQDRIDPDMVRISAFACQVRERLQPYLSFVTFLGGISTHSTSASDPRTDNAAFNPVKSPTIGSSRQSSTLRDTSSSSAPQALSLLNQGPETSTEYKRLIASYAGVPLGKELATLRQISTHLTHWGY